MQGDKAHVRQSRAGLAAVLVAGYAASVILSVLVSRDAGGAASLWTANGFLAAAFILLPRAWRFGVAGVCVAAQAATGLAVGDGPARAALYPLVNLAEAGLTGWLAIRFCDVRARRLSLRELTLLPIVAIAPAAAAAGVLGGAISLLLAGEPPLEAWLAWTIPGALGMAIVLPAILLAVRTGQYKEFARPPLESAAILAALGVLVAVVYLQRELPLQFTLFPALTIIAARLGPPGAAAAALLTATIALPLTLLGHGPAALAPHLDIAGRVRLTELVVAAAMITTLVTAVAVGEQTRLRRLMLGRDRAARAARLRARRAERAAAEAAEARATAVKPRERVAGLV
ncbi:MAG TPA: MASE1 domain-containing protein [Caulobacteraceae bacterium]